VRVTWCVLLVACGDNRDVPDAAIDAIVDARVADAPPCVTYELASCVGAIARIEFVSFDGCAPPTMIEHACATACELEFERLNLGSRAMPSFEPRILCAETPPMFEGASCGPTLCMPTRAILHGDGAVANHYYIACGEEICISRPAPYIADFGAPCVATAYDERETTRAACHAGGHTEYCVGDWECPTGTLCDDDVGTPRPVCKPGPRGQ
jgi:hypothetical protein